MTTRARWSFTGGVLLALATAAVLALSGAGWGLVSGKPVREITLVARGTAFFTPEGGDGNPVLELHPGERVRLRIRNEDPGVEHAFAIPALGVAPRTLRPGEVVVVEIRVPETGAAEYTCPRHLPLMRGRLEVRPATP